MRMRMSWLWNLRDTWKTDCMTAKERLQKSNAFKAVAAMIASPEFELAAEVAMLEYVSNLPVGMDAAQAMASHHQLNGAKNYLRTINNLIRIPEPPKAETQGLNHRIQ